MKPIAIALLFALALSLPACRSNVPQETDGSITPTQATEATEPTQATDPTQATGSQEPTADTDSAKILQKIWDSYGEDQRFSVYGGQVEMAVNDGPGDLDVSDAEELNIRYLLPQDQAFQVAEGASLIHLMNNNIFTAVVFKVKDGGQMKAFSDTWSKAIRDNQWICGQPDRLLIAQVDGSHILMSFGSQDLMQDFETKLKEAYPDSKLLHKEAIVA